MRIHNPGSGMFGLLAYHETKVEKGVAEIIGHFGMRFKSGIEPHDVRFGTKFARFEKNISHNQTVSKPTFHASINPSEYDIKIMDDHIAMEIAQRYIKELGYSNSPFILYKHNDVERIHYHIVGVRVDDDGKRVNDFQELNRSNKIREAISLDYGFKLEQKAKSNLKIETQKIEYGKTDITSMIKRGVLASIAKRPSSWSEFKAELKALNIGFSFVNNEGKKGLLYHVVDPENGKRLGVAIKSSIISKEAGIVSLSQNFPSSQPNIITQELKDYAKAETILNAIYREQRRSGIYFFESELIKDLPNQSKHFSEKLLEKIPSLNEKYTNIINHYIQSKNNLIKEVELKEQGYFVKNVYSLLEFTKNFDRMAKPIDVASFYASNNLTISEKENYYNIGHQKGGNVSIQLSKGSINLPLTTNITAIPLKKNDRDLILAFSDPTKIKNFIQQSGHLGILKNQTFNLLDKSSKNIFLKQINTYLINDIIKNQDLSNKSSNALLANLFVNGYTINQEVVSNKKQLLVGHYGLGLAAKVNMPITIQDTLLKSNFSPFEMENYNKLGFLDNGKPRPLYTALVSINSAIDKNNKLGIEKSLNFICNSNFKLGNELIENYEKNGMSEIFKEGLNSKIFKELEILAYGEKETIITNEFSHKSQVSNLGSAIAEVFDFSLSGKGVQTGGAPKDRFEGKKFKKIKTAKIINKS